MAWRLSSGDVMAFKVLLVLAAAYGIMSCMVYGLVHMWHVRPLGVEAPLDRFSEGRALVHLRRLTVDIPSRQEGSPGLEQAAQYIKGQLKMIAERAGPEYSIEIEETHISGSFNMMFLHRSISLGYRNHKNIAMRISSKNSKDNDTSVLVNGHYDTPPGSPGAGDCGSCVVSMLETARQIVDSDWIPPQPLIFLFNGAEELFLLGSHGFAKTNKWRRTVGAFINIEASGTGGFDLVCQSGPGSWPSQIYAESAIYPMANSAAQDAFGIIPGDTDYRIFSKDHGDIPGLDIIFLLGGYYYHTSYDTMERLLPGSIQARGENLFKIIEAFASSPLLQNADQRSLSGAANRTNGDRPVFTDYLSWFMIFYSRRTSLVLHSLPLILFFLLPCFLSFPNISLRSCLAIFFDLMKGMLFHAIGVLLAIIIPVALAVFRLFFSSHAMNWFAHPYLAFLMFVPSSLVGLLIPKTFWGFFPISNIAPSAKVSTEALAEAAHFWGAFGLYSLMTMACLRAGLGGGFMSFFVSASMVVAWFSLRLLSKYVGHQSIKSLAGYVIPLVPCLIYSIDFGGFLVQFLIEKMGMMGSFPLPYGFFIPDIIVATVTGVVTGWCVGPLVPILGRWLARSSILQCLLQISFIGLAVSSQFFPYGNAAPKRVILQHTFMTADGSKILESSYDISVTDANSVGFLFKHAPDAAAMLQIDSESFSHTTFRPDRSSLVAMYPITMLLSKSWKFPTPSDDIYKHYRYLPNMSVREPVSISKPGFRTVHLELDLGSLDEIWVAAFNITGPLSNWSFADNKLPAPEIIDGGPPSYILKLSGKSNENWRFWLEANSSDALRVELAVLDQYLVDDVKKLKSLFPDWVDVTAFSTFFSSYIF